MYKVAPKL